MAASIRFIEHGFRASAYIDALVSGYPAQKRDTVFMIMLQGAFDDSGSEPSAPYFVLGGFIANVVQWKLFSDLWHAKLTTEPAIDYFKMSEAIALDGQFKGWSRPHRDQKVFELAEIIVPHIEARIDCAMAWRDFNVFMKGVMPTEEFKDPYFLLFYHLILTVNSLHQRLGRDDVDMRYIFDHQSAMGTRAASWWELVKRTVHPDRSELLGVPPIFDDDRRFMPLQAADMYAWLMRNRLAKRGEKELLSSAVLKLFAGKLFMRKHLNKDAMMRLGANLLVLNAKASGLLN